jgi:spermidine/putrescine transport system permease protein
MAVNAAVETRPQKVPFLKLIRESKIAQGLALMSPADTYLFVFMVVPLILVGVLSFLSRGTYGQVEFRFNLSNYTRLWDPLYGKILVYSLGVGVATTVLSLVIGYPLAYYIARAPARQRSLLLFLVLLPFWTNFIIRIYAWIMILREGGFLDSFMHWVGLGNASLHLLYTPTAVMIGMLYEFLPFMVLPLYTSLEKIGNDVMEAAADLGAPPLQVFLRVTLPLSFPGMSAGTILVFIPAMGMFVIPDLMGGAKTILIGNVIRNQFLTARDWPFGAAASMILMVLTMIFTFYYARRVGLSEELVV